MIAVTVVVAVSSCAAVGQTVTKPTDEMPAWARAGIRASQLGTAMRQYLKDNNSRMPADFGDVFENLRKPGVPEAKLEARDVVQNVFMVPEEDGSVPRKVDAEWVNEHASFVYLGQAGVHTAAVPEWDRIAVASLRGDLAYPAPAPGGEFVNVLFLDGHVSSIPPADAESIIRESRAVFGALADGSPMPPRYQLSADLKRITAGLNAYIKEHAGTYPKSIGAVFPYIERAIDEDDADMARMFLAPSDRKSTSIPMQVSAEWIDTHTCLVYLGSEAIKQLGCEDRVRLLSAYTKGEAGVTTVLQGKVVPAAHTISVSGGVRVESVEYIADLARESKSVFQAMAAGTPLPEYHHAFRDLRLLLGAILAYANEHGDTLPPDLSETLPFLPPEFLNSATSEQIYRVYLSPRAEASVVAFPTEIDPEWIRAHATYQYTPKAGTKLSTAREAAAILVYSPPNEVFRRRVSWGEVESIPYADALGGVDYDRPEDFKLRLAETLQRLDPKKP